MTDRAAALAPLNDSAGYLVRRAYRAFTRALEQRLAAHDVSISMWFFLRLLWLEDGKTQKALSEELGLSQPTTVPAIDNLEKRGFVERRRNTADRRKSNVFLTPAGRALEIVLVPYVTEVNGIALDGLSPQEQILARQLLVRMIGSLDVDLAVRASAKDGNDGPVRPPRRTRG
jgi:MarR family transcriptional regulator, organic hydroperoxide resistance regulator